MNEKSTITVLLLAFIGLTAWYGVMAGPAGAGLMAKQVCSLVHVSGFTPKRAVDTYIKPLLGPAMPFMSLRIDPVRRQVAVTTLGVHTSVAVHHPGYGCIQLHERTTADIQSLLPPYAAKPVEVQKVDREHRPSYFDVTALKSAAGTRWE